MFIKIVTIIFYAGIALWAFGVGFPFLMVIIGICAAILAIVHAM
jgi:hypothetical protein